MILKKTSLVFALSMAFMSKAIASHPVSQQPETESDREVESLLSLCADVIKPTLLVEVARNNYTTLDAIEQSIPNEKTISELFFKDALRPVLPLNPTLAKYVQVLDLSSMDLYRNPKVLASLQGCELLTSLNVSNNWLGQHVQYLAALTGLKNLDVSNNCLDLAQYTPMSFLGPIESNTGHIYNFDSLISARKNLKASLPNTNIIF